MSARQRHFQPGYIYHVLNRGALRQTLFNRDAAYDAFEELIRETLDLTPLPIFTYTLMPNHWHFVVQPSSKEELSDFFQYLSGTHAKRFRVFTSTRGEGHVYQDRFKSFPLEGDGHFLCVCRYVERNALCANLVRRSESWRWCGLWHRLNRSDGHLVSDWPVPRPADWVNWVNTPLTTKELELIHNSIRRGRPLGNPAWVEKTAEHLGLEHTLRAPGRPKVCVR